MRCVQADQEKGESAFLEVVTENGNEDPWVVELSLKGEAGDLQHRHRV